MTGPAFSIARGGEEIVDELFGGLGALVFDISGDFFWSREATVEIDKEASCKGGAISGRSKIKIILGELLLNKGVDWMPGNASFHGVEGTE
jgi:hypothetical protein